MDKTEQIKFKRVMRALWDEDYLGGAPLTVLDEDEARAHFARIPAELVESLSAEKLALILIGMQRAAVDAREAETRRMHRIHPIWKFIDGIRVKLEYLRYGLPAPQNKEIPQTAA